MTEPSKEAVARALSSIHHPEEEEALRAYVAALEKSLEEARRERDAAVAGNAALLGVARFFESGLEDVVKNGAGADLGWMKEETAAAMLRVISSPHPGAALLEEMETLRQRQSLWEEAASTLYGYSVFIGPCLHGRVPWDRCDECGEESAVHALVKVNNALLERMKRLEWFARTGLTRYHNGVSCPYAHGARPENPAECEHAECREWTKALEET